MDRLDRAILYHHHVLQNKNKTNKARNSNRGKKRKANGSECTTGFAATSGTSLGEQSPDHGTSNKKARHSTSGPADTTDCASVRAVTNTAEIPVPTLEELGWTLRTHKPHNPNKSVRFAEPETLQSFQSGNSPLRDSHKLRAMRPAPVQGSTPKRKSEVKEGGSLDINDGNRPFDHMSGGNPPIDHQYGETTPFTHIGLGIKESASIDCLANNTAECSGISSTTVHSLCGFGPDLMAQKIANMKPGAARTSSLNRMRPVWQRSFNPEIRAHYPVFIPPGSITRFPPMEMTNREPTHPSRGTLDTTKLPGVFPQSTNALRLPSLTSLAPPPANNMAGATNVDRSHPDFWQHSSSNRARGSYFVNCTSNLPHGTGGYSSINNIVMAPQHPVPDMGNTLRSPPVPPPTIHAPRPFRPFSVASVARPIANDLIEKNDGRRPEPKVEQRLPNPVVKSSYPNSLTLDLAASVPGFTLINMVNKDPQAPHPKFANTANVYDVPPPFILKSQPPDPNRRPEPKTQAKIEIHKENVPGQKVWHSPPRPGQTHPTIYRLVEVDAPDEQEHARNKANSLPPTIHQDAMTLQRCTEGMEATRREHTNIRALARHEHAVTACWILQVGQRAKMVWNCDVCDAFGRV
ncbi:MAG: hypothetical protein Q9168_002921 [Polycauliona sp. 1 TL-2023]